MKLNKKDILYTMSSIGILIMGIVMLGVIIDVAVLGLHFAITNPIPTIASSLLGLLLIIFFSKKS